MIATRLQRASPRESCKQSFRKVTRQIHLGHVGKCGLRAEVPRTSHSKSSSYATESFLFLQLFCELERQPTEEQEEAQSVTNVLPVPKIRKTGGTPGARRRNFAPPMPAQSTMQRQSQHVKTPNLTMPIATSARREVRVNSNNRQLRSLSQTPTVHMENGLSRAKASRFDTAFEGSLSAA